MALALDSSIEASLARSFLENEGIISFLFDGQSQWTAAPPVSIPTRLMVAEEDLEEAVRLLRDADARGAR